MLQLVSWAPSPGPDRDEEAEELTRVMGSPHSKGKVGLGGGLGPAKKASEINSLKKRKEVPQTDETVEVPCHKSASFNWCRSL